MNIISSVQDSLTIKPKLGSKIPQYFNLYVSYLEYTNPTSKRSEMIRLGRLLTQHPKGLTREALLQMFYDDYLTCSYNKKLSLKSCLEKMIQRSRLHFLEYGMTIDYCREAKKYTLKLI